jgi:LPS sulfotransferase NodH
MRTVYLVAVTPRTGTTLLCQALAAAGAGEPGEWFSRADLAKAGLSGLATPGAAEPERSVAVCRAYILDRLRRTCRNRVSGFKLHWHQLAQLVRAGAGEVVRELLSGRLVPARVHAILVTRSPADVQAVSVLRAYASGLFAVDGAGARTVLRYDDAFWGPPGIVAAARARLVGGDLYDYADLRRICEALEQANAGWRDYLDGIGTPTWHTSYEDLASDPPGRTNEVLAMLGVPALPATYRPTLVVQRDAATVAMLERYRSDAARARALRQTTALG